jgi:hypothetical protein
VSLQITAVANQFYSLNRARVFLGGTDGDDAISTEMGYLFGEAQEMRSNLPERQDVEPFAAFPIPDAGETSVMRFAIESGLPTLLKELPTYNALSDEEKNRLYDLADGSNGKPRGFIQPPGSDI